MIRLKTYQQNSVITPLFFPLSILSPSVYLPVQMVSEKVGGAEGTKLDDDFRDLERVRDWVFVKFSLLICLIFPF